MVCIHETLFSYGFVVVEPRIKTLIDSDSGPLITPKPEWGGCLTLEITILASSSSELGQRRQATTWESCTMPFHPGIYKANNGTIFRARFLLGTPFRVLRSCFRDERCLEVSWNLVSHALVSLQVSL